MLLHRVAPTFALLSPAQGLPDLLFPRAVVRVFANHVSRLLSAISVKNHGLNLVFVQARLHHYVKNRVISPPITLKPSMAHSCYSGRASYFTMNKLPLAL